MVIGQKCGYDERAGAHAVDIGAGNDDGDGDGWCGLQKSFGGLKQQT